MNDKKIKQYIPLDCPVEFFNNSAIFEVESSKIIELVRSLYQDKGLTFKLVTATDERKINGCFKIWYIFGLPKENFFVVPYIRLKDTIEFPSLSSIIHEAWTYERKIKTFFGLIPVGHPNPRSIILHENWPNNIFPLRKDFDWKNRPELAAEHFQFKKVKGEGIYEIPVGPIHAGIIEPGHFRFSMAGEEIILLEPRLGYTHKGSEKLFELLSLDNQVHLSEKISGDSSFSHSLAYCQAIEKLGNIIISKKTEYLRVIYAELERISNHFGDIGAIMLDAGFNFGGSQGAKFKEQIMQLNEKLTGNRFLRGVNKIGGVASDINVNNKIYLMENLTKIFKDFSEVINIAENSVSLLNRLKGTGVVSVEVTKDRGFRGIISKALGFVNDARIDYPYAAYDKILIDVPTETTGDVYARFLVRIKEVFVSQKIIENALLKLTKEPIILPKKILLKSNSVAVSCVEGWRGEILYFITTDNKSRINRVVPLDPSFINWSAISYAALGNMIPDFPLINKSFNLSYSGNDL